MRTTAVSPCVWRRWRRAVRRRAISSPTPNGLLTKSSAPRSSASIFSASRSRADSTMIGTSRPLPHLADHVLAVAVGQAEVEHHDVGRLRGDALHAPRRAVPALVHLVVVGFQRRLEEALDGRLVVDDEDTRRCRVMAPPPRAGNAASTRVPRPSATGLSASIVPPCASTMPLAMASPRPVPSPPSAARFRCAPADEFLEDVRQHVGTDPRPVVGDTQQHGCRH